MIYGAAAKQHVVKSHARSWSCALGRLDHRMLGALLRAHDTPFLSSRIVLVLHAPIFHFIWAAMQDFINEFPVTVFFPWGTFLSASAVIMLC